MVKKTEYFLNDIGIKGVVANNSVGAPGDVLASNGSSTYWTATVGGGGGFTGSQGATGFVGSKGDLGFTGSQGAGFTGSASTVAGPTGFTGSQGVGFTGSQGAGFTGSQGATGFVGSQGAQGNIGFTGSKGDIGFTGSASTVAGPSGFTGSGGTGPTGFTGSASTVAGPTGFTGSKGDLGFTGSQGAGFTGSASTTPGPAGFTGSKGDIGFTGSASTVAGPTGFTGSGGTGPSGPTGFTGSQGVIGFTGSKGDIGFTGSASTVAGPSGFTGSQGNTGTTGFTGSKGDTGTTGFTGSQGIQGVIGFTGSRGNVGFTGSAGPIGGSTTQVIFNDAGSANGSAGFTFNKTSNTVSVANSVIINGGTAWHSGNDGPGSGLNADLLDNMDAPGLYNNMGFVHTSFTDFNSVPDHGSYFVQGTTNGPGTGSSQYHVLNMGIGSDYAYSAYTLQMAMGRYSDIEGSTTINGNKYISMRTREAGTWSGWYKVAAGLADKIGYTHPSSAGFGALTYTGYAPEGASMYSGSSSNTGAIRVRLPGGDATHKNALISFTIRVFQYDPGKSFDVVCHGYTYDDGARWINCSATILGDPSSNVDFTVRFGYDEPSSRFCVYIGELASTWAYARVQVLDVGVNYTQEQAKLWIDNWAIDYVTSFSTIAVTKTNIVAGKYFNNQLIWNAGNDGAGSGLDADTLDGYQPAISQVANTLVVRDGSGYVALSYINSNTSNNENPTISQFITDNGDGYFRKSSFEHARRSIFAQNAWITDNGGNNRLFFGTSERWYLKSASNTGEAFEFRRLDDTTVALMSTNGDFRATAKVTCGGASGFSAATYATNSRNPIYRFDNADGYGLSYFQGTAGYTSGVDTIGFHFGTATAAASALAVTRDGDIRVNSIGYAGNSFRAPVFYDSNNTGFYVDPASGTNLGGIVTFSGGSKIVANGDITARRDSGTAGVLYFGNGTPYLYYDGSVFVLNGGTLSTTAGAAMYAGLYYDSVDTSYFFDGNSQTNMNIAFAYYHRRYSHHTGHLEGGYNNIGSSDSYSNPIFTIGSAYNPASTTLASMYGIGYSEATSATFNPSGATTWGMYVAAAGTAGIWLEGVGNIIAIGNITAYASDKRLKTNIKPIENALDKLMRIRGVEFDWIDNIKDIGFTPQTMHETGVIAQEIQEVIPDAVVIAPFNNNATEIAGYDSEYLTVDKEKIIPLLIEAVKELSIINQEQQLCINKLEKKITSMESNK